MAEQITPTGTVSFKSASTTARERNETYINGILNGESTIADAGGELLSAMKFWNGKDYVRATQQDKTAITPDSIRQISIDMPADEKGDVRTRYFKQVDALHGTENKSGLKATAWEEITKSGEPVWVDKDGAATAKGQGKREIRVSFTGFLDPKQDGPALNEGVQGRLNPQTLDTVAFTHGVVEKLDKTVGKANIEMIYHSHSFGSSNLRTARAVAELEGAPSKNKALMFDAGLIGDSQSDLIHQAMNDTNSPLYKKMQATLGTDIASKDKLHAAGERLNQQNLLLTPIQQDGKGEWHGSHVANAQPGGGWSSGLKQLIEDGITGKDRTLETPSGKYGETVLVKVGQVPGYETSSALGFVDSPHQEVPLVYSAGKADNFVTAVNKSNGLPPVTVASLKEGTAAMSAVPVGALIELAGGNGQIFIDSALEANKGNYLASAKKAGEAMMSIFSHDSNTAAVKTSSADLTADNSRSNPRTR